MVVTIHAMRGKTRPFLSRIFGNSLTPIINEVWRYSEQEAAVYGGYTDHHGIDFAVPSGTPVLAAASGYALASFEEVPIRHPGPQQNIWQGEPVYWGLGLFVIIVHSDGFTTTYAHLQAVAPQLNRAYIEPLLSRSDAIPPFAPLQDLKSARQHGAVKVRAGQLIGYSGITGMGMGVRTYDNWLAGKPYRVNDDEHVHFAVSSMPALAAGTAYVDPFGIYGAAAAEYPAYMSDWSQLPGSLWLQ